MKTPALTCNASAFYCREFARKLGLDEAFVDKIFFASPMHDIGKIGIPDHILLKPGGFMPDEWEIMKGHSAIGAKILGNSKSPYLIMGAMIALNHHERWDGGGYPYGRRGNDIPLAARIMNICDIYDALRSKRPYKPAFDHQKTVDIITHAMGAPSRSILTRLFLKRSSNTTKCSAIFSRGTRHRFIRSYDSHDKFI